MNDVELRQAMNGMSFYHTLPLTPTLSTPGWPVVVPIVEMTRQAMGKIDLRGKRVLDVGCRDGLFSFEAEKLGAAEVIGIDHDLTPGVTDFLIKQYNSKVQIRSFDLFDLRPDTFGKFDVVIFPGVLYHLRYPCWALKLLRNLLADDGVMVLETAILADDNRHALIYCPIGPENPYEATCVTFFNRKGLHDTLSSMGFRTGYWKCLMNLGTTARSVLPDKPQIDRCLTFCFKAPGLTETNDYWDNGPKPTDRPTWHAHPTRAA